MKKLFIMVTVMVLSVSSLHAGFFSSMFGSVAANSMTSGRPAPASSFKELNTYLWDMHKANKYDKAWEFYAKQLSVTNEIEYLDTVARAYYDNGYENKALEIYETRILPFSRIKSAKTKSNYASYYNELRGETSEIDYAALTLDAMEVLEDKEEIHSGINSIQVLILLLLIANLYFGIDINKIKNFKLKGFKIKK